MIFDLEHIHGFPVPPLPYPESSEGFHEVVYAVRATAYENGAFRVRSEVV